MKNKRKKKTGIDFERVRQNLAFVNATQGNNEEDNEELKLAAFMALFHSDYKGRNGKGPLCRGEIRDMLGHGS